MPCPTQEWQLGDPKFDALPGAEVFFGQRRRDHKIELPDTWNGELALYAHGFVSNGGAQGSALRVGNLPIREHLIKEGCASAASSYRCNGYVPGQGLVDTMALTDLFTKLNGGRAPQRVFLTGTSMEPCTGPAICSCRSFLEQSLKRAVVASGKESLLAQRIYRIAGHCGFSQSEMAKAFDDLTTWVHKGTKAAGDEVYGDLSNAGITFTDPLRPNDPGGVRVTPGKP